MSKRTLRELGAAIVADIQAAKTAFRDAGRMQQEIPRRDRIQKQQFVPVERIVSLKLQIREEIVKEAQAPPRWVSSVANDVAALVWEAA